MSDKDLIEFIAKTWLANGGDAEGFILTMYSIKEKIKELEVIGEKPWPSNKN